MVRRMAWLAMLAAAASLVAQQVGNSPLPTLRTGTKLVVVDVTVTDQNHHAIHGLKAEDFTLLENNARQTVKSFEEHQPPSAAELQRVAPMPKAEPGVFTNFTPAASAAVNGPVDVLLIDRLNTPTQDQTRLRNQLLDYLAKAKPGSRTAIFGLNAQLVLLQGFTTDPAVLRSVLEKKDNARASALMDPTVATGGMEDRLSDYLERLSAGGDKGLVTIAAYTRLFEAVQDAQQTMDRSRLTLDAMNALARYLVNIPGRKNLIWFSGSFPLDIAPDPKLAAEIQSLNAQGAGVSVGTDFITVEDDVAEYRETASLLSRAQVVVYPIDARGAVLLPNTTVAGEGGSGERYLPADRGVGKISGAQKLANDIDTAMEKNFTESTTMRDLAFDTGGRAFLNHNDLADTMAEALDDGSSYYSLSYTPSNGDWRGDFRKIEVKLRQKGYELSYRRGYYADDPSAPPSVRAKLASGRAVTTSLKVPDFGAMHLALMHGGPEPTEVLLKVQARQTGGALEDMAATGNMTRNGLKGPFRRYAVEVTADAGTLEFTGTADGQHHASAEVATFVYDADGTLVNGIGQTIAADLKPAAYDAVLKNGLPVRQEISVPDKGEYFLRVVVHDLTGDRVGAVEFPVSEVRGLTPAGADVRAAAVPKEAAVATAKATEAAAGSPASAATEDVATRVTATTTAVLAPAAEAELNAVLAGVHRNYEAYLSSVPNLYASEHVTSGVSVRDQLDSSRMQSSAESIFRLRRTDAEAPMVESREVKSIDEKPVPAGSNFSGPVLVYGVFTYATGFLAPEARPCYDYRMQTNQRLHGAKVTVIEYELRTPAPAGAQCPFTEASSGRAYVDPATMQVLRLEQKRPRHVLDEKNGGGMVQATPDQGGASFADVPTRSAVDMLSAMARANQSQNAGPITVPSGTRVNWSWAVDYAPVSLDNQMFWLPKAVTSSTMTLSGRMIVWSFEAKYTDFHLMEVKSKVLGANGEAISK